MADAIGISGIHNVSGKCDLCGERVDALTEELNALDCTYQDCPPLVYHQDCLEKYLKSIRLEKNRKTGFRCPRGSGKGSSSADACPGKIDKSHPIHPRNYVGKKKKVKPPPEAPNRVQKGVHRAAEKPKSCAKEGKAPAKTARAQLTTAHSASATQVWDKPEASTKGVSRTSSLSSELVGVSLEPRKSISSTCSAYSSAASATGPSSSFDSQEVGMRPASVPLFNAWSKPVVGGTHTQVPDIHSLSAFPPSLTGSEDPKNNDRPSSSTQNTSRMPSCWLNASKSQPVPTIAGSQTPLADASCQSQNLSLPNSSSSLLENGEMLVGMDYADGVDTKLTKAQKKNMKRAERKKKSARTSVSPPPRPDEAALTPAASKPEGLVNPASAPALGGTSDPSNHSSEYVLADLFLETLVAWKTLYHIRQLQTLGFEAWQSAEAIRRFGSNLECAITWLLDDDEDFADSANGKLNDKIPEVDVSPELTYIKDVQELLSLPKHVIQQAVIDCDGDIDSAVVVVMEGQGRLSQIGPKNNAFETLSDNIVQDASDLPFSFDHGSAQVVNKAIGCNQNGLRQTLELNKAVGAMEGQQEWPETVSEQLMLGGVLGSKLEEYMSGNADFTSLANKGIGGHSAPKMPGFGRITQENLSSELEQLHSDQLLYRNMTQSTTGTADLAQYNRILGFDLSARNSMHCVGYGGGSLSGAASSWDARISPGYSSLPMPGDMIQDDQQDWRHLIGNLLES